MSVTKTATISEDGVYRYTLGRYWHPTASPLTFVMLNPSTADAQLDDPTIRRCIGFAKRENYGGIKVVNAYAFRTAYPYELDAADDPIGPENALHLHDAALDAWRHGTPVVCAWGAGIDRDRAREVIDLIQSTRARAVCLGVTKNGFPKHPLYVRGDAPFITYNGVLS